MRSLIPNLLLSLGSGLQKLAMWFTVKAIDLHMRLNTQEGKAISELNKEIKKYMDKKDRRDEIKKTTNSSKKSGTKGCFVKKDPGNA